MKHLWETLGCQLGCGYKLGKAATRCHWHSMGSEHQCTWHAATAATTCPGRKEGEKHTPTGRSPFLLQWPCSALCRQNLTGSEGAYLSVALQSRPRRMDLELRNNKLIAGKRCNSFNIKSTSPAFSCLPFTWFYLFPSTFNLSMYLYLKYTSFRLHI